METTRRDVRRQCATHAVYRPIPEDGDILLKITKRLRVTSTGNGISKYDNQRAGIILIFGTGRKLDFLQNSDNWFIDGTFLTVPPQFAQLYTVHE